MQRALTVERTINSPEDSDMRRTFARVVIASSVFAFTWPTLASAQDVLDKPAVELLRREYLADLTTLHDKIVALAQAIPEEKYSWRPATGVRSISEVLMHVASEWYLWAPHSIGAQEAEIVKDGPPAAARLEKTTSKADVLTHLESSWKFTKAAIEDADLTRLTGTYKPWNQNFPRAALGMAGDLHEHLGQLIGYARAVGVKPPWTK